jgi:cytochrome c biogenesis protein CcmG/thiol:disulfide interchange protein DsbE
VEEVMSEQQLGATETAGKPGSIVSRLGTAAAGRAGVLLPVLVFAVIAVALGVGLTMNPREIPSALIGQSVPEFDLPPVQGSPLGLSSEDLRGEVSLVNVWASWCTECRVEHPLFMDLAKRQVVPLHGINYKDLPKDARKWLNDLGDPYTRNGADRNGRAAIDLGVYGVPETFVIDQQGRIAYKHIGAVTPDVLRDEILVLVRDLRQQGQQ